MPDLRLDTGELSVTASTLRTVSAALAATGSVADAAADAAGDAGLAAAVRDFADSSTRRRFEVGTAIDDYAKRVQDAVTAFEQTEDALAASLVGEG